MKSWHRRLIVLTFLSRGMLLATGCSVAQAIIATIQAALQIVNIWV